MPASVAGDALAPLPLDAAVAAGLIDQTAGSVRARLEIRPYGEADTAPGALLWWVVSDFGADVRSGPLATDHVLGIGGASASLAQATPRRNVGRALDIGTGCGVQALHLATHAAEVVGTDVSARALRLAATTAALSGVELELRSGSLTAPVTGQRFDLVVANPPFVVSDGRAGYDYRDSGLAGDALCARLVAELPGVLARGGSAHLLANWIVPRDGDWRRRVGEWVARSGCDAWVWQREVLDPGEYVTLWLRDAGLTPRDPAWNSRYTAWRDWLDDAGAAAIGMGVVHLWQTDESPVVELEDVPQHLEQPIGPYLPGWVARQRWSVRTTDGELLATALRAADGLVLDRSDVLAVDGGWRPAVATLRQSSGMHWSVEADESIAALVAACDGTRPLAAGIAVLAAVLERSVDEVAAAALPVVRELVGRGFLEPPDGRASVPAAP